MGKGIVKKHFLALTGAQSYLTVCYNQQIALQSYMEQVKASIFLGEISTDGHSPMKFICNDGNVYYCKYRVSHKTEELDCLIYEVICHNLLKFLGIPTPDIALVELLDGTFSSKELTRNKNFAKPGVICFGSKEIKILIL